jgi:GGDEF domain-containing protein
MDKTTQVGVSNQVTASEFAARIQSSINKSGQTGRPFLVLLIQIANMQAFRNQRPTLVVNALLREILTAVRKALHPSQYVGVFQDGLGFVFEGMDVGQADVLARKLTMLTQHVIKTGKYNDMSSRWTDIIYQFLWPNKPGIIFPCAGWSVYPRDGMTPRDMVKRAMAHIAELRR